MKDPRKIYLKQVGRRLHGSRQERAELLSGLASEIAECGSGSATLSLTELYAQFGAPAEVAEELQLLIPLESVIKYDRRRRLLSRGLICICVLAAVLSIGLALHTLNHDVWIIDSKVYYD